MRRGGADGVGRGRLRTRGYGDARELRENWGQPGRLSNFVRDHSEELFVVIFIGLEKLLRERLARRRRSDRTRLPMYLCLVLFPVVLRPYREELAHFAGVPVAEAHGDASGVDEEIELDAAQETDPVCPLHLSALASGVDGARRDGIWGKCEAPAPRPAERLGRYPGRGEVRSEVSFERQLELDDGRGRVAYD